MNNIESTQEHLDLALAKMEAHEISAALAVLNEHMQAEEVKWLEAAGECCYRLGDFKQAVCWWEQARETRTASSAILKRLGDIRKPSFQFWMKRFDEAIDQMERKNFPAAMEMLQELKLEQEGFVSLYELLGLCYLANGDRSRAQQAWKKGLEIDCSHENLLGYIAATTPAAEAPLPIVPPAVKVKAEVRRYNSNSLQILAGAACLILILGAYAWHQNSVVAVNQKILDPPVQIAARAEYPAPELPVAVAEKTVLQADAVVQVDAGESGEEEMGGSDYDQSQVLHYYETGYKAYRQGDLTNAASNLGMVVSMGKQDYLHREAQYYLARISFLQKDYPRAQRLYSRYLELFPNSNYYDDTLFYLGWVYDEMGQPEHTRECFQRLKDLNEPGGYTTTPLYLRIMQG